MKAFFALLISCVVAACMPSSQQVGAVTDAACTMLVAFGGTPQEQAICATASDLLELAASIREARADAGSAKKAGKCQMVGSVCATDEELAAAIVAMHKSAGH